MPRPRLIELRRIAAGFDHLAEQLQKTLASQRHLALRLLAVREEERRRLARELHDEFGQCLASIGAEAAFIGGRAEARDPDLLPAARAIAAVTAHMMESLQGILPAAAGGTGGVRPERGPRGPGGAGGVGRPIACSS
jgi:protein-histidine pros-kinase